MTSWILSGPKSYIVLVVLGCAVFSVSACRSSKDGKPSSADVDAINRLHQRDVDASKAWDVDTLVSLWTEDIVTLPPEGPPVIGKEANRISLVQMRDASRDFKITEYNLSFHEIKVVGDWAFEWGTFTGATEPVAGGPPMRSSGSLMRVLKREGADWKVARTIYNGSAPESGDQ